jgi:hypothetical protein
MDKRAEPYPNVLLFDWSIILNSTGISPTSSTLRWNGIHTAMTTDAGIRASCILPEYTPISNSFPLSSRLISSQNIAQSGVMVGNDSVMGWDALIYNKNIAVSARVCAQIHRQSSRIFP